MSRLRDAAAEARTAVGAWVLLPTVLGTETLGKAGLDYLLLDVQHSSIGWDDLLGLVQAAKVGGSDALVRVEWNDPARIMRALDLGATGVVVPMVSTPEQARQAALAVRYPPEGVRSFGPLRPGTPPDRANAEALCLPMVETAEALDHLEAIISTDGVDGVFVGPVDLALSLGLPADYTSFAPQVMDAVDEVVRLCREHGKLSGTASLSAALTQDLLSRGLHFLTFGSDNGYLRQGAARDLALVQQWSASGGPAG